MSIQFSQSPASRLLRALFDVSIVQLRERNSVRARIASGPGRVKVFVWQHPGQTAQERGAAGLQIHIVPDLVALTFRGTEDITIDALSRLRKTVLNANQLEIDAASLNGQGLPSISLQPQMDTEQQTLTFTLPQVLAKGHYTLSLRYRGVINRSAQGLYYDWYKVGTDEKIMIGSNLEATDARSFFPSWDEPAFRARFQVPADVPATFTAISNMPVEQLHTLPNGWKRFSFATTPTMSTYLVVLAAGEMERSSVMKNRTEIGVVTTVGKQASAAFTKDQPRPGALLQRLLWRALPLAQAGPYCRSGWLRRCYGKLGGRYLQRDRNAVRPGQESRVHTTARVQHRGA